MQCGSLLSRSWPKGLGRWNDLRPYSSAEFLTKNVGKLMPLDKGLVQEGIAPAVLRHEELTGRLDSLIRHQDVRLNEELDNMIREGKVMTDSNAYVLSGPTKCGKTMSMLRLVEQRRKSGWLVLFVRARKWSFGKYFYNGAYKTKKEKMQGVEPLWYDRPEQSRELLQSLRTAHGDILGDLPVLTDSETVKESKAESILELVDYGLRLYDRLDEDWFTFPRLLGDATDAVMEELKAAEDVPVMIAVDEYPSFFGMSGLSSADGNKLVSQALRFSWHFRDPMKLANSIKNGVFVASLSGRYMGFLNTKKEKAASCRMVPLNANDHYNLVKDPSDIRHVGDITRGLTYEIPRFTEEETQAMLTYTNQIGLVSDVFSPEKANYLHALTQGTPEELLTICKAF
mmetsp:Transcript_21800/g.88778  ORF Transcript_21800/g.88778 Transcript_21800/m.88778 type:complete len:399 (-) Transcript_21800:2056-3252(-)